jgi:hypothetical protein
MSSTDTASPKYEALKALSVLPSRPMLLRLSELPRCTQSSTLMVEPKSVDP